MMKHLKYIALVSACFFVSTSLACNRTSATRPTTLIVPSVEDTILQNIGDKLYFSNRIVPSDPITVIATNHRNLGERGRYLEYEFIVHSCSTSYHKRFTSAGLDKHYKAYLAKDADMPEWYDEAYKKHYDALMAKQKKEAGGAKDTTIDEAICNYTGYWIYLRHYNGQFYINDVWAWLRSFHISNYAITDHYMDGLYPSVIDIFEENMNGEEDGNFLIKTIHNEHPMQYILINKELEVYKQGNDYVTPARNANRFEIIEYANNTGDLIASGR